ncbi:cd7 antigen-like [Kryptolebias marmoratus]|uniref:cd7 antigen-like n=1 Tax=Kryptolebias marmoratus TaxID=37003 RepID=UPI0007F882D9|nr:cd7 antigen-like [Kryptolebias marmoratus]
MKRMTRVPRLARLWALLVIQTGFGLSAAVFVERQEGDSVLLPCDMAPGSPPPYGFYLKRGWLRPGEVLFQYTKEALSVKDSAYGGRLSVSGDPSAHSVNVTISQLRAADTDRYFCEFMLEKEASEDERIPGKTEFFLLVNSDALLDVVLVQTCPGGSAVLPCHSPNGEGLAVEGVSLTRQRGREAAEVVYDSKQHRGGSRFPAERVRLSSAPGLGGITYNVTLQQLQPEDSALYSCQLLLRGRPHRSAGLGRRGFFVSVQGDRCGCSSYDTLLYALSGAVGLLLVLLVGFIVKFKVKVRRSANSQPPQPIYEEMVGVQSPSQKMAPLRLEDVDYKHVAMKRSSSENHYERPSGALYPRTLAQE